MKLRNSRLRLNRIGALIAVFALLMPVSSEAASPVTEAGPPGTAAYRMDVRQAAVSRLTTFRMTAPEPEPPRKPLPHPRFASQRFAVLIEEAARNADLDPALVHAVIAVESGYNPAARSVKGAIGLMQVLPETAARYGVANPAISPEENLRAGTRYLSYLMTLFDNRIELALAAYNAGEYAVQRHGHRIPPYRETQNYVPAVLAKYRRLQEREPPPVPATAGIQYMPGTTIEPGAVDKLIYRLGNVPRYGRH